MFFVYDPLQCAEPGFLESTTFVTIAVWSSAVVSVTFASDWCLDLLSEVFPDEEQFILIQNYFQFMKKVLFQPRGKRF